MKKNIFCLSIVLAFALMAFAADLSDLDEVDKAFVLDCKIPITLINTGEICGIRSYTAQFKILKENQPVFSFPNSMSEVLYKSKRDLQVFAHGTWTGNEMHDDWYFIELKNGLKGWVFLDSISYEDGDPDLWEKEKM